MLLTIASIVFIGAGVLFAIANGVISSMAERRYNARVGDPTA